MKKVIALVLTLAMLVSCFAFSASADTVAPTLVIEGASQVVEGDTYTVNIRLNDDSNVVGGFEGALAYTNATVKEIVVNPQVLAYNNTDEAGANTVIKDVDGTIKFATVADLNGTNPATRIWFKVTFTAGANPTFTLKDVVFSDKAAKVLDGTTGAALNPTTPVAGAPEVSLKKAGILEQIVPNDQGIVVQAGISIPEGETVDEYGVVFYPTSLLQGAELTVETSGAVVAAVTKDNEKFQKFIDNGMFSAVLNFNFSTDEKAAQFMGTKVTARVYYKVGDSTVYSANSVDKYIQGGVADKAALNTVLDYSDTVKENHSNIETSAYTAARGALNTSDDGWYNNRKTVLEYAVDNATYKAE